MISALSWIPRGAAKSFTQENGFTEEELAAARLAAEEAANEDPASSEGGEEEDNDMEVADAGQGSDDEESQVARAKAFAAALKSSEVPMAKDGIDSAMAELNMEAYDDEDEAQPGKGVRGVFGSSHPGMAYYGADEDDPYIQLAAVDTADSEAGDFNIREDDFILLAARNEDDVSHLEVWVYEEAEETGGPSNLFVHHDILLPAFPLSVAWMDCNPRGGADAGNFAAVGTMSPGIEIWDLDVAESVEPVASLGGELTDDTVQVSVRQESKPQKRGQEKEKKKKKKKQKTLREGSHTDAVLGLSWNQEYRNVLASGSADNSVKVWDVATQSCQVTLERHSDKVQTVAWNPAEAPVLLSGSFDKSACLGDSRSPSSHLTWSVSADVEALAWDPFNPTNFLVSSEDGIVAAFDARLGQAAKPLYRLSAHDKPACCLSFCPAAKGLLATASTDKQAKIWDVSKKPSLVASQDMKIGALFSAAFCLEQPNLYAVGGSKGEVVVWDVLSSPSIIERFGRQFRQQQSSRS